MAEFPSLISAIEEILQGSELVVINFAPFESLTASIANSDAMLKAIEIDRPALIRAAAAKPNVAVVVDPADYDLVQGEIKAHGQVTLELRRRLAAKAFAYVARYDAAIANWLSDQAGVKFPELFLLGGKLAQPLRYGENPHQEAGFYYTGGKRSGVSTARQVQGKELSYNNINDTDAAYECVAEFSPQRTFACVIVKHANPCGVAEGSSLVDAYRKALRCDPISAFGGVVALNKPLDADAARAISEIFTEVIIAPEATEEAMAIVGAKKNLRLLLAGELPDPRAPGAILKSVAGGFLLQSRDNAVVDDMPLRVVTERKPTSTEQLDLLFAYRVVKHVKSNAIVYAKNCATVGIGAGQMSRVDAARIAMHKTESAAKEVGELLTKGSVVASDAFFPFADGLMVAVEAGATAVIQPGGSVRDEEVIKAANDHGVAMTFTGRRHFRH